MKLQFTRPKESSKMIIHEQQQRSLMNKRVNINMYNVGGTVIQTMKMMLNIYSHLRSKRFERKPKDVSYLKEEGHVRKEYHLTSTVSCINYGKFISFSLYLQANCSCIFRNPKLQENVSFCELKNIDLFIMDEKQTKLLEWSNSQIHIQESMI